MNAGAVSLAVWYGLTVLAVVVTFVLADVPVARQRVEAFAARQGLTVTGDNCRQVIAYLAVTRRWRSAGVAGASTWYLVADLRHQSIGIHLAYALSGWFVGALIAEVRVSGPITARRAASLQRRTAHHYLPPLNRRVLATTAVACLALAGIAAATGSVAPGRAMAVWVAAAIGLPAVVAVVARKILLRPQPQASPDVLSADEAIRRRSLRVVSASAITLLLYCVADQLRVLLDRADAGTAAAVVLILAGAVAVPVSGWRLAGGRVPA
jgi:hypothetical protein